MILVDTGPIVALFDPADEAHEDARDTLRGLRRALTTTVPVLTEALHLLGAGEPGVAALDEMIRRRGLHVWYLSEPSLARCFELVAKYRDHPMDLADASLVAAAESLRTTDVWTIDRRDFLAYRARIGRGHRAFRLVT